MSASAVMQPVAESISAKRIVIATIFGLIAGGLCASAAFQFGILKFAPLTLAFVLLNRAVMGFAIGVSGLRLHWAWHGILMGIVVGSIFSFYLFLNIGGALPLMNALANGIFGLLIEFFTSVVFKQPPLRPFR